MTAPVALLLFQFLVVPTVPGGGVPLAQAATQPAPPTTQDATSIAGLVRDASGGAVSGATVIVRLASGGLRQTLTDPTGRFSLALPAVGDDITLIVRSGGFSEYRQTIGSAANRQGLEVVLEAASISEAVTVTPTRTEQRLGDTPASVSVLDKEEIRRSPGVVADDLLRQLPTFSLFRRASSVSAHPTTQGVSLRGIAPSGVSRTLVLLDGVPYNDAFGGWVYWTSIPMEGAERIEVVDGASSSLYGTYAMGGVINFVTSAAARRTVEMKAQYGSRSSPKFDVRATDVWGKVGISVDASAFTTDGYPNVVAVNPAGVAERGAIDNNVNVDFRNFSVKLDYDPSSRVHAFVRSGYFHEERDNGKISTFDPATEEANNTTWKYTSGGVKVRMADSSELQATVFGDTKEFRSNFMAVPTSTPPRSVGRMTLNQLVPTTSYGGMVQWSRTFGRKHSLAAGMDFRWVDGDSVEDVLDPQTGTRVTLHRVSGGTQRNTGLFIQDVITPTDRLTLTLSARIDQWRNLDPHNTETTIATGVVSDPVLPEGKDTVGSPRVGALYRLTDRISVWGDYATGFRAPTLNELYRRFSVGTTTTLANPELGPERLKGGEIGVSIMPVRGLTWRTTWFDNRVKDPVANLTISQVGSVVTQQRQNLGRTKIWGLQTDAEYQIGASWRISGAYLYNQAKVVEAPQNPALVNNCNGVAGEACYLQQVPAHRGSFEIAYADPRFVNIAFSVLGTGRQFDDDLNTRTVPGYSTPGLPKFAIISLSVSRALGRNVDVFVSGQNLLDEEYFVGTLPTLTGPPRLVNGGIRIRFQAR